MSRLPLGTATTVEFAGPFLVATALGRRRRHLGWAAAALAGVVRTAHPAFWHRWDAAAVARVLGQGAAAGAGAGG